MLDRQSNLTWVLTGTPAVNTRRGFFSRHEHSPVAFFPDIPANVESVRATIAAQKGDDQIRRAIDGDIARLEDAAFQLKRIRNSSTPLVRLPSEVLAEIAEHLVAIWPSSRPPNRTDRSSNVTFGWVWLSHVCFELRSTLLLCRHLWARNISDIPLPPDIVCARCGDAPLTIIIRERRHFADGMMFAFASKHICQAREIDFEDYLLRQNTISRPVGALSTLIHPHLFLKSALPRLESLKICQKFGYSQPSEDDRDLSVMVAPRLRSLHLVDFSIPFQPETLTSLTLHFLEMNPLPAEEFLDILRHCTLLENLAVLNCMTALLTIHADTRDLIPLCHLDRLSIEGSMDMCMSLLSSVSVPKLSTTAVDITDVQAYDPQAAPRLSTILPCLQPAVHGVTGIALYDNSGEDYETEEELINTRLTLYVPDPGHIVPGTWSGPFANDHRVQLRLWLKRDVIFPPQFHVLLGIASSSIDFSSINTISVLCSHEFATSVWSESFSRFPQATTLYFESPQHTRALQALKVHETLQDERGHALPSLRFLWLLELNVENEDRPSRRFRRDATEDNWIIDAQFLEILSSRARCGQAIERLRINRLFMDEFSATHFFLPRLRALVPNVEINRITPRW